MCGRGSGKDASRCCLLTYVRIALLVALLVGILRNDENGYYDSAGAGVGGGYTTEEGSDNHLPLILQLTAISLYGGFILADIYFSTRYISNGTNDEDDDDRIFGSMAYLTCILPIHIICGALFIASEGFWDKDLEDEKATEHHVLKAARDDRMKHKLLTPTFFTILGGSLIFLGLVEVLTMSCEGFWHGIFDCVDRAGGKFGLGGYSYINQLAAFPFVFVYEKYERHVDNKRWAREEQHRQAAALHAVGRVREDSGIPQMSSGEQAVLTTV